MPLDSSLYALIPVRRWYMPWVWDLYRISWSHIPKPGGYIEITEPMQLMASKLRRDEAEGLMRLLGAANTGD